MKTLPRSENAPVLRTDFSNNAAWESLCAEIQRPVGAFGFRANLDCISDPVFDGLTAEQVLALVPEDDAHSFLFIVDSAALMHSDHPILVVDLWTQRGRTFRVIPAEMWAVENNLSLANMDFEEFADSADADGVFRGFPRP
jgi:hypothetical protein